MHLIVIVVIFVIDMMVINKEFKKTGDGEMKKYIEIKSGSKVYKIRVADDSDVEAYKKDAKELKRLGRKKYYEIYGDGH